MPTEPILAETIAGIQRTPADDLDHIALKRAAGPTEKAVLSRRTRTLTSCAA
jgi:hypothetical protein